MSAATARARELGEEAGKTRDFGTAEDAWSYWYACEYLHGCPGTEADYDAAYTEFCRAYREAAT